MLPTTDPPQNKRPTQTESECLEKNIPSKWTGINSWGNNTYITQNRFQNKSHKKRQRKLFHNSKGKNPTRTYQHCKYICTQYRSS